MNRSRSVSDIVVFLLVCRFIPTMLVSLIVTSLSRNKLYKNQYVRRLRGGRGSTLCLERFGLRGSVHIALSSIGET